MLQNAYFLAKIGADTAENEQHFAEILPTDALWRLCRRRPRVVLPVRRSERLRKASDGVRDPALDALRNLVGVRVPLEN